MGDVLHFRFFSGFHFPPQGLSFVLTFAPVSDATLTRLIRPTERRCGVNVGCLIRPTAGDSQADKAFTPHPAISADIYTIMQSLSLPLSFLSTITNFVLFLFSSLNFQFIFYKF
ncbi:hypothetical protein OSV86_06040 [Escherichia marmotae]|uniref:hypothetical protein n=1 Tax=Escherichia marmotae TaxID=1499973 RepID=UPI0023B33AFC|nr:hypothetical protein [Escherichia marmotae]MDE9779663.1 hypothetical protein [Escherichia marmotae]